MRLNDIGGKDEHRIGGLGSEYIDYDDLINVNEN